MKKKWWMESVGYQIYTKSFYDSNDDGIGDLKGIYEKLDTLKRLGITLIWICPFYDSPMDDNGYDVRDFYKVSDMFGHIEDLKQVIDKAHQLGMKIIFDYVLNHTSDEHPWFIESRSSKDSPYRDFYIWREPQVFNGKKVPPNNWGSFFGGSAWAYDAVTDSYYMKIFSNKMPDLNWTHQPVRQAMAEVAQFYISLGCDGFRIDAVSHLDRGDFKDAQGDKDAIILDWNKFSNLPKVHTYLKELKQKVFEPSQCLTIGEVGGQATMCAALDYASFNANELDMVFNFDHNWCNNLWEIDDINDLKTDVVQLKKVFLKWHGAFKDQGWLPLNWLNHDQPRLMSQYGSKTYPLESAKMLATALYLMRGTPFVYQGEEIGMTNYPFTKFEEFNDISSINYYHYLKEKHPEFDEASLIRKVAKTTRDHPRTAMQWDASAYAGFSNVKPIVLIHPNHKTINVLEQINDESSLWRHYQKLFQLRQSEMYKDLIVYGDYEILDIEDPYLYTYLRRHKTQTLLVINSMTEQKTTYHVSKYSIQACIIKNYEDILIHDQIITLRPYESIAILVKEETHL